MNRTAKIILASTVLAGAATAVVVKRKKLAEAAGDVADDVVEAKNVVLDLAGDYFMRLQRLGYFRRKPSAQLAALMIKYAAQYGLPLDVFTAVVYNESGFSEKTPNFRKEPGSYKKWKAAGSKMSDGRKWTDVYDADHWGSGGPTQTMIFNVVDKPGGLKPGEWFDKLTLEMSVSMGALALSKCYAKQSGSDAMRWYKAVACYNGSGDKANSVYVLHVAAHQKALGGTTPIITPESMAEIQRILAKHSGEALYAKAYSDYLKVA